MDRVVLITAKLSLDTQRAQGKSSPHAKLPAKKLATPVQQEFRDLRGRRERRDEGRGGCGLEVGLAFELHKTQPIAQVVGVAWTNRM
jgi:hypothetical protein